MLYESILGNISEITLYIHSFMLYTDIHKGGEIVKIQETTSNA